jgi:hypothetical protein
MPGRPPNQAGREPCKTSGNRHNAAITTSTFGGAEKRHTMRHPPTARGAVHPTLPAAQALPDTTECTLIGNPTTVTLCSTLSPAEQCAAGTVERKRRSTAPEGRGEPSQARPPGRPRAFSVAFADVLGLDPNPSADLQGFSMVCTHSDVWVGSPRVGSSAVRPSRKALQARWISPRYRS